MIIPSDKDYPRLHFQKNILCGKQYQHRQSVPGSEYSVSAKFDG